ncbi:HAD family phosphatase [Breznakia sp. OttesenSCG-928-G09]|nr:HAD family phosphatase [Breznakia sp. OttesenSCG-928-G09]
MIRYIIFDMDGVLINSEIAYLNLFQMFLKENGVHKTMDELHFLAGSSRATEDRYLAELIKQDAKTTNRLKHEFYSRYPIDYNLIKRPYVNEVLQELKARKITLALASSSPIDNIYEVLDACNIREYFSVIVSGDNFERTKPDPEIYEFTVQALHADKQEVLVIEDSVYGIQAGKAADLEVIALLDPILEHDTSSADYQITNLKGIFDIVDQRKGGLM